MDQNSLVIQELKTNRVTCYALWLWSMVNGQKHVKNINILQEMLQNFYRGFDHSRTLGVTQLQMLLPS